MRDLHTNLRLLGAGLAASIGLFTLGAAASPSFAATSSLPDVSPVTCPAGMTCPSSNPSSNGGTTDTHHHVKPSPKPKHHKPAPTKPAPHNVSPHSNAPKNASLNDSLENTSTDPGGVKWH